MPARRVQEVLGLPALLAFSESPWVIASLLAMVATARYALLRPGRVDGSRPLSLRSTGVSPAGRSVPKRS
jgi:hypothetical protein